MIIGSLALILTQYQACSDVSFSSSSKSVTDFEDPRSPIASEDLGLLGGHFDLDTSTQIYPFNKGTTDHHVHEYDDKYDVQSADFFKLYDQKFLQINQAISVNQKFNLILANASLSPGAIIEINGVEKLAINYTGQTTIYTLGVPATGEVQLKSLSIKFAKDALLKGGLVPTATSCVRANNPGALGEYRNGALTLQALIDKGSTVDPVLNVATSGLLWEATLFWHYDGPCYGRSK